MCKPKVLIYILLLILFIINLKFIKSNSEEQGIIIPCYGYQLDHRKRKSSNKYISGDTFRAESEFIIDETKIPFFPSKVEFGDTIFVNGDILEDFFKICHPLIKNSYILISHNSDFPIPGKFVNLLDDKKIIAWFGQNVDYKHPKLFSLPIGIANSHWPWGNVEILDEIINNNKPIKNKLLYMNFVIDTYPKERAKVYQMFANKDFCFKSARKDFFSYLIDLSESKFVICPRGNGIDCHRIWDTLLVGSFPIVKTSSLDVLFEDLPVVIINEWDDITQKFLEDKYLQMINKKYNMDKIYSKYWLNKIKAIRIENKNEYKIY